MDFVATITDYADDTGAQTVKSWYDDLVKDVEGLTYYRAPLFGAGEPFADLTIFSVEFQPIVLKVADWTIDEITVHAPDHWSITRSGNTSSFSPLDIDEVRHRLQAKLDQERRVRGRFAVRSYLALPAIAGSDFYAKCGWMPSLIFLQEEIGATLEKLSKPLDDEEYRISLATIQGVRPLNTRYAGPPPAVISKLSDAIHHLERNIAVLDKDQIKVAHQVPPGPQRIRGLAGTGKTVLLALKAANLHARYADKKILFTFHTQSLYNHVRRLVSQFYRDLTNGLDPDLDVLHIRHAWGGRQKAGVYSDLCKSVGAPPLDFTQARLRDSSLPFSACCEHALTLSIQPVYDFILIDEAQDFPPNFFRVAWQLCKSFDSDANSRPIYWAYDELQTLTNLDIPDVVKQFGLNNDGVPKVSLDGPAYTGDIEKDFILHRAYRCPHETLMVAHGIGLGIKNIHGPVQMLGDADSWRSIGYIVEGNQFAPGEEVILYRPPENSPNPLSKLKDTVQPLLLSRVFNQRDDEIQTVAESIRSDIQEQGIRPEQIIVISLDSRRARTNLIFLQSKLVQMGIASVIPGLVDGSSEFLEIGKVTLSTVYRAKGNEAPMVYILASEKLYDYVAEVENRNRVFTAMSRSKGWVRMTGVGQGMQRLQDEIAAIMADFPRFKFIFPAMDKIRKLDAETAFRKRELRKAREAVRSLSEIDSAAITGLDEKSRRTLLERSLEAILQGNASPELAQIAKSLMEKLGQ